VLNTMKKLILCFAVPLLALCLTAGGARAAEGGVAWDKFPMQRVTDLAALQHGAKLFTNYCLNCHAAAYVRYNRMRDIGLTEDEIKANLLFAGDKVGETMKVSLEANQAKEWFGVVPPDLSVISRSRSSAKGSGADYLYTYLRTYYRDSSKPTGWNNLAYPNSAMPHVLWELQGEQKPVFAEIDDPHHPGKKMSVFKEFEQVSPGQLSPAEYNDAMADLVAFMQWMGEPAQAQRERIGVWVLLFLGVLTIFAWRLNAAYWKDIK
jgi:ubiquinol-cytochrome c reductase cytochrome c1 subunit